MLTKYTHGQVLEMKPDELNSVVLELAGWRRVEGVWVGPEENEFLITHSALAHERKPPNYVYEFTRMMELWRNAPQTKGWSLIACFREEHSIVTAKHGASGRQIKVKEEDGDALFTAPLALARVIVLCIMEEASDA